MKNLILILLFTVPLFVISQTGNSEFKVSTSELYEGVESFNLRYNDKGFGLVSDYKDFELVNNFYFNIENNILIVKYLNGNIYLQKYNEVDKKVIAQRKHLIKDDGDVFEKIMKVGNRYIILFSNYNKDSQEDKLFYYEINIENLTLSEEVTIVNSKNGVAYFGVKNGFILSENRLKYDFVFSNDSNRLLIQYRLIPKENDDDINKDIIGLSVFNSDLELEWTEELEMPYEESKINNMDYGIDNNSNVYILCEKYKSAVPKDYVDNVFNKDLLLFKIEKGKIISEILTNDIGLRYNEFKLLLKEEKVSAIGTYSGTYYGKVYKEDLSPNSLIFIDFINDDFEINYIHDLKYYSRVDLLYKTKYYRAIDLSRTKIKQNKDGSILLIEEEGDYNKIGREYFNYGSVILIKISKDYKVAWNLNIPKFQISGLTKDNASFVFLEKGDFGYFFYVDIIKNREEVVKNCLMFKSDDLHCVKVSMISGEVEEKSVVFNFYETLPKEKIRFFISTFSSDKFIETESGVAFEISDRKYNNRMIHVDF